MVASGLWIVPRGAGGAQPAVGTYFRAGPHAETTTRFVIGDEPYGICYWTLMEILHVYCGFSLHLSQICFTALIHAQSLL